MEVAGDMGSGVRGLATGAAHVLIEDGAWVPTHAISNKELHARHPTPRPLLPRSPACPPATKQPDANSPSVLAGAHLYNDRRAFEVEGLAELVLEVPAIGKVQVHRVVEGQRVGRR